MRRKIPFLNTDIKTDLLITLFLIPLWWVLGFNIFIYHFVAVWLAVKLLVLSVKQERKIYIPKITLFLFLYIFIYGCSILVNLPFNEPIRTVASLYNYSFWIMGLLLIVIVHNSLLTEDVLVVGRAFKRNIIFVGFLSIIALCLWFHGYRDVSYPSPLLMGISRIRGIPLLKDSATIVILCRDWIASRECPRVLAFSPYPTALGGVIILMLPLIAGYYRIKRGKIGIFQWGVVGLALMALLLTTSRTSILALPIAVMIVYILKRRHWIAIVFLGFLVLLLLFPSIIDFLKWFNEFRAGSTEFRLKLYKCAVDIVLEKNLILGIGVKPRGEGFYAPVGSHSMYISILLRTGIVGLIIFILFQIHLLLKWFRMHLLLTSKSQKELWKSIGISLIAISLWMLTEDLDAPQLVAFLYFLIIGILTVLDRTVRGTEGDLIL